MPQIGHFPKQPSIEASKQGGKVERRRLCLEKRPVSMSPAAESTLQCYTPILYSAVNFKHHYCCLHYMFFPLGGRLGGDTLAWQHAGAFQAELSTRCFLPSKASPATRSRIWASLYHVNPVNPVVMIFQLGSFLCNFEKEKRMICQSQHVVDALRRKKMQTFYVLMLSVEKPDQHASQVRSHWSQGG